ERPLLGLGEAARLVFGVDAREHARGDEEILRASAALLLEVCLELDLVAEPQAALDFEARADPPGEGLTHPIRRGDPTLIVQRRPEAQKPEGRRDDDHREPQIPTLVHAWSGCLVREALFFLAGLGGHVEPRDARAENVDLG